MITVTASVFAALCVLALGHLVFNIYPHSAIAMARHNLFNLRDELFALAEEGKLDFKSPGYKAMRMMINGLIKYAHDVSLTQIFITQFITKIRGQQRPSHADWDRAIAKLSDEEKEHVQRIYRMAMVHMIRLLVTKSVLLSMLFILGCLVRAGVLCTKSVFATAASAVRRRKVISEQVEVDRDEKVWREVLAKPPGRKFKTFVTSEARRYTTPGFGQLVAA
ncbi:hypothetical protein [Stenotrophomonas acidaminiphila]|uniref:hypothetical protein n=1 Tax=Stenotrophomonas acidaminiphila TaxID=128780 RepID=UPI001FAFCF87|nr:hypothetical protein [Stenotrophomonas acidaminiphila]